MSKRQSLRMRFGEFHIPKEELPSPEELYENITDEPTVRNEKIVVKGEDPVKLVEKGFNPTLSEGRGDHDFCQFIYATNKENTVPTMQEDGTKAALDNEVARPFVFFFNNGQFAFESVDGLNHHWIPQFIAKRTGVPVVDKYEFYDFNQDIMDDFFHTNDEITEFKFGSVEDSTAITSEIGKALDALAEEVGSQEFSGGDPPTDLSELDIFQEAVEATSVQKLRGRKNDGYMTEILLSGMYEVVWDDEGIDDEKLQADTIYNGMAKYLNRFR